MFYMVNVGMRCINYKETGIVWYPFDLLATLNSKHMFVSVELQ